MRIRAENAFQATPDVVYAMLTSRDYLEFLANGAKATERQINTTEHSVDVVLSIPARGGLAGLGQTTTRLRFQIDWNPVQEDGSRVGDFVVTVLSAPAKLTGRTTIRPGKHVTKVIYEGDLQVSAPAVSTKLASFMAPQLTELIGRGQDAGIDWLQSQS